MNVPKDKCPLDILAGMGKTTKDSWIFLHQNAVEKLQRIAEKHEMLRTYQICFWNATKEFPETTVMIEANDSKTWLQVMQIQADDIAFTVSAKDPDEIFFLKMEE